MYSGASGEVIPLNPFTLRLPQPHAGIDGAEVAAPAKDQQRVDFNFGNFRQVLREQ